MLYPGFVGSLGTVRSRNQNAEHLINWYEEEAPGTPKTRSRLQYTPRLKPFVSLADGPIRALFAQNGRCFAVSGTSLYEVFANHTATLRGTTVADGDPATIISNGSNGNQLGITSGSLFYVYDLLTNVVTEVTTGWEPLQMCAFTDGYGLVLKRDSNLFAFSDLEDLTSWDPLDFNAVSTVSDQLVSMVVAHREIWLLGSQSSSVWANVGDADNPFQPIPGVQIAMGCSAPFSVVVMDNTVIWLGQSEHGRGVFFRGQGYSPQRISNAAVEFFLNQYPRIDDAIGWAYTEEGHLFYCLFLPTPPNPNFPVRNGGIHTTLVYDVSTQKWHERALWNPPWLPVSGRWQPHVGRCHAWAFDRYHLVGDRQGPTIYEQTLTPDPSGEVVDVVRVVN